MWKNSQDILKERSLHFTLHFYVYSMLLFVKKFLKCIFIFPLKCYTFIFVYLFFKCRQYLRILFLKTKKKIFFIIFGCTPAACGILVPRPGLEHMPLCLGRAQSQPLNHQGSPLIFKVVVEYTQRKIPFWPFSSVQFTGIRYIHIVVDPPPPSISRTLFIFPNCNSVPIKPSLSIPIPQTLWTTVLFPVYELTYSRHLI